ncbi:MAG TPA: DUF3800 domain-containing protein [Candidatus Saccharimonadales bacterium]|nr:DUF3800 domain-containing protein [Candidatus Saccharimonadales bacterium]
MSKMNMYDFLCLDERDSPNLTELKGKTRKEIKEVSNIRYFGLCGITLSGINYPALNIQGRNIQDRFKQRNNHTPFHYIDILHKRDEYSWLLNDKDLCRSFLDRLNNLVRDTEYKIIGSFINKNELALQYGTFQDGKLSLIKKIKPNISPLTTPAKINLYDISLKFLLADYFKYLKDKHRKGLIIAESRGDYEDANLLSSFYKYQKSGTGTLSGKDLRENILDLLIVKKKQNHIGIQIADLITYPIYDFFIPNHTVRNDHFIKKEFIEKKILTLNTYPNKKGA